MVAKTLRCAVGVFTIGVVSTGCAGSPSPPFTLTKQLDAQSYAAVPACKTGIRGSVRCDLFVQSVGPVRADSGLPAGWSPADLQSAYNLPSRTKGGGEIVAVVDAYDNPDVASDLAEYRSTYGLPSGSFHKYNQTGEQKDYPKGNTGWGIEIDNDVEMVSASCPRCTIYLIEANSDQWSDIETAQAEAVRLSAHVVSDSFQGTGADESYWDTTGVTYVASSGNPFVDPAVFETVVAVGGTVLSKGGGGRRAWAETVWSSAGGGCAVGNKPPWQHDKYAKSCEGRLGNDVSAVAEGVAEYDSYGGYGWITASGTAIGAPFLSGIFALAKNATRQDGGRTFWQTAHHKYLYEVQRVERNSATPREVAGAPLTASAPFDIGAPRAPAPQHDVRESGP